jgi:hypothetical protein
MWQAKVGIPIDSLNIPSFENTLKVREIDHLNQPCFLTDRTTLKKKHHGVRPFMQTTYEEQEMLMSPSISTDVFSKEPRVSINPIHVGRI